MIGKLNWPIDKSSEERTPFGRLGHSQPEKNRALLVSSEHQYLPGQPKNAIALTS
jgi:hypothetical protein